MIKSIIFINNKYLQQCLIKMNKYFFKIKCSKKEQIIFFIKELSSTNRYLNKNYLIFLLIFINTRKIKEIPLKKK